MSFPATILDLQADLFIAGTWTSMTSYVYQRSQIPQINRGRAQNDTSATPAQLIAELNNRDGRFSPLNPTGPWYGLIGRNTPIRVHVPGSARLRFEDDNTSSASTPTASALNLAGDLEARIDLKLSNWTASVLASKWSATAGNFSWAWLLNSDGTLDFWYTTDGSTIVTATSTQPLPWPGGRISLKVTYAHSSGTVAFWYATAIGGSYTQIGASVVTGTTGALKAGTAALAVGANTYLAGLGGYAGTLGDPDGVAWQPLAYNGLQGAVYEFRLLNGIGGSAVADPVFSSQTPGASSFADSQSNTWTMNGTSAISDRSFRFHGEVAEWPSRWDSTGNDVYVPVAASGVMRRLVQRSAPLGSAFTRAWQRVTGTYAPVAYWPCEDGNNGQATTLGLSSIETVVPTQIASGLASGRAMGLSGKQTLFAASTDFPCSSAIPVPGLGIWSGGVRPYTQPSSPANVVRLLLSVPSGGDTDTAILARIHTHGDTARFDLEYGVVNSGSLQVAGYDNSGSQTFASGFVNFGGLNGNPCMVEFAITTNGSGITWHVNTLLAGNTTQQGLAGNVSSTAVGVTTAVYVNPAGVNVKSAIGQISVQAAYARMDSVTSADSLIGPLNGWAGETAGLRFARLCAEQGIAWRIVGYPSTSVAMGAQTPQTFLELLQECEDADHGLIHDPRGALAMAYRCSGLMAAQSTSAAGVLPVALSYTAADLGGGSDGVGLQPTNDDQLTINDEITTRASGSVIGSGFEATATGAQFSATAAMCISEPPAGVGLYQDSQSVNVNLDSQLGDQASWLVHMGTVNELRWPAIPMNLARSQLSALQTLIAEADIGDYVTITSPPSWCGPDTIKAVVYGCQETLGGYHWEIEWMTRPESPWEVLIAGSGALGDCRADADGSTLASSYASGVTSLSVATAAGDPIWTTIAGDLPFDVIVAGERMTVTAVSGSSSPQTMTVTRSVNGVVKAQASDATVNVFQPSYAALA